MSQVETVARAMFDAEQDNSHLRMQINLAIYGVAVMTWERACEAQPAVAEKYRAAARAAITAMRIPSPAMEAIGEDHEPCIGIGSIFTAMMDAALGECGKREEYREAKANQTPLTDVQQIEVRLHNKGRLASVSWWQQGIKYGVSIGSSVSEPTLFAWFRAPDSAELNNPPSEHA